MTDAAQHPQSEAAAAIRRRLYEYKNGVVADALRAGGCPYRMIWGLNLPQLREVAAGTEPSVALAEELWADSTLREAHLAGALVYPGPLPDIDTARRWLSGIRWTEDADILCFSLLRKADYAAELAADLSLSDEPLKRYTALRLYFNIVSTRPREALAAAMREAGRPKPISTLAAMLAEEARFVLGE